MRTLARKGYWRIYVKQESHIERVKELIEKLDSFEYDYLPDNLITTFDNYPSVEYTGKFEMDLDKLEANCMNEGISIFCFDSWSYEYPSDDILNNNQD